MQDRAIKKKQKRKNVAIVGLCMFVFLLGSLTAIADDINVEISIDEEVENDFLIQEDESAYPFDKEEIVYISDESLTVLPDFYIIEEESADIPLEILLKQGNNMVVETSSYSTEFSETLADNEIVVAISPYIVENLPIVLEDEKVTDIRVLD